MAALAMRQVTRSAGIGSVPTGQVGFGDWGSHGDEERDLECSDGLKEWVADCTLVAGIVSTGGWLEGEDDCEECPTPNEELAAAV
jgi:hypothetical protein